MRLRYVLPAVGVMICAFVAGCPSQRTGSSIEDEVLLVEKDRRLIRKRVDEWLDAMGRGDYSAMWKMFPATVKAKYAEAWKMERERLRGMPREARSKWLKRFGVSSWKQAMEMDAGEFFRRSMEAYSNVSRDGGADIHLTSEDYAYERLDFLGTGDLVEVVVRTLKGPARRLRLRLRRYDDDWRVVAVP